MKTTEIKKSKWKTWHKVLLGIAVIFFGLMTIGILADPGPEVEPTSHEKEIKPEQTAKIEPAKPEGFDIPSLIRKDSTEINKLIGLPSERFIPTEIQKTVDIPAQYTYQNGRFVLDIEFNPLSGVPEKFMLTDSSAFIEDYRVLLEPCNLTEESDKYLIKPIKIPNRDRYTGVTIIPN